MMKNISMSESDANYKAGPVNTTGFWTIRKKVICFLIIAGLVPLGLFSSIFISKVKQELIETNKMRLVSLREEKKFQIENYFNQIRFQANTLAKDQIVKSAMKDFTQSFFAVEQELGEHLTPDKKRKLKERYSYQMENTPEAPGNSESLWFPKGKTSQILQSLYISENPQPIGEKHNLDFAPDGSQYSKHHKKYHPVIRNVLENFGYYDIFLVEPESGHVVYSVFKEVDYSTSLTTGPYANSGIGNSFKKALSLSEGQIYLEDYAAYEPSYNAAAAFISVPIYEASTLLGVLIFQAPIDQIDNLITSNKAWEKVGLGKSGEVYIVGKDSKMRNNSRFLIQDSDNYFKILQEQGVPEQVIKFSKALGSSISQNEIKSKGAQEAISGKQGFDIFHDYRNASVLGAFGPVNIKGFKWSIMAKIDRDEALQSLDAMMTWTIGFIVILVIALVVFSLFVASRFSKPILNLVTRANHIIQGRLQETSDFKMPADELGLLGNTFDNMQADLKAFINASSKILQGNLDVDISKQKGEFKESLNSMILLTKEKQAADIEMARVNCMMENNPAAIMFADLDFNIRYINPAGQKLLKPFEEIIGLKAEEVAGQNIDRFHKDPQFQRNILSNPKNLPHKAIVHLGPEILEMEIEAIYDNAGEYIGPMLSWGVITPKIELEKQLEKSAEALGMASQQLNSISQTMAGNAEETAAQASVVSTASDGVNKGMETVAAGSEQMTASIKEIAQSATQAAQISAKAVETASTTNTTISRLGDSSSEIGEVIKVINSIAEQTNLLALNATIEAARAGEAGKGFAVVANEVKELAKETSKATEDISNKIQTIQGDTHESVLAIEEILKVIRQIDDVSNSIASAVEEQSLTTSEMSRNITDAASKSHEIRSNISGVADAARETSSGVMEIQNSASELSQMAQGFKDLLLTKDRKNGS